MAICSVELTMNEFVHAMTAASHRLLTSTTAGLNAATTYTRTWMERAKEEIIGACGEVAFAKWSGMFAMPSLNTFHRVPDCLSDTEIRSTDRPNGCLIIRDNDDPARRYVLALVSGPIVTLAGWITGREARQPSYVRNPNGHRESWFVPQEALRSMSDFDVPSVF